MPEFGQELIRRHKKRIVLEHAPYNYLRVSAQYVHNRRGAELVQIVGTDYDVVVLREAHGLISSRTPRSVPRLEGLRAPIPYWPRDASFRNHFFRPSLRTS